MRNKGSGIDMYKCPMCGKEISERTALYQHICDECLEKYCSIGEILEDED